MHVAHAGARLISVIRLDRHAARTEAASVPFDWTVSMRRLGVVVLATFAFACADSESPTALHQDGPRASISDGRAGRSFIVTLRPGVDAAGLAKEHGLAAQFAYANVLNGFAGEISDLARAGLLRDVRVLAVEEVLPVSIANDSATSWGLDRVDQRPRTLDGMYAYDRSGAGVTAYVVDTGIRVSHEEFEGRASRGFDAFSPGGDDCHGHGTHVAGTVGGLTHGVARGVSLVAVRVLGCDGSGTTAGVVAGLDWILANAVRPAVVNMSLSGAASQAVDDAVVRLTQAGIAVVVAAGNSSLDACGYSPARAASAITVAASDMNDERAGFSNYGACVDWFAPGVSIVSAYNTADDAKTVMSGTSMAAPHTAGAAALVLEREPWLSAYAVRDSLWNHATKNVVSYSYSENPHLLYSLDGYDPDDGNPPVSPPVLAPTGLTAAASTTVVGVTLTWAQPEPNASAVEIFWRTAGQAFSWTQMVSGPATFTRVDLTNQELAAGKSYEFAVRTRTRHGILSELSNIASATTCNAGGSGKCARTSDGGSGSTRPGGKGKGR
jgi:subtilisin family serine protease